MKLRPLPFRWIAVDLVDQDGVAERVMAMVPNKPYRKTAAMQYEEGQEYLLAPHEARSMASHGHYFATIHEYYVNLPETIMARWPSSEHFRKWCLCETGWYSEKEFEMADEKKAESLAHFIRTEDEFARIFVRAARVLVHLPLSQSLRAMGKTDFEASKQDVLALAAQFVGVSPSAMGNEVGRHA